MIEPQIHHGQPGLIGEHHGLQKLTETLAALSQGQTSQQHRATALQTQLARQAQALRWHGWGLGLLLGLMGGLSGLVGWQVTHPAHMPYAKALGALDTTLAQQWSTLPKGVQEQLTATYTRLGIPGPSERTRAK